MIHKQIPTINERHVPQQPTSRKPRNYINNPQYKCSRILSSLKSHICGTRFLCTSLGRLARFFPIDECHSHNNYQHCHAIQQHAIESNNSNSRCFATIFALVSCRNVKVFLTGWCGSQYISDMRAALRKIWYECVYVLGYLDNLIMPTETTRKRRLLAVSQGARV